MATTINDVARNAGVSRGTVTNVISNSSRVSEENRRKVLESVKELNYIPNETARMLRLGHSGRKDASRKTYNVGCVTFLKTSTEKFIHPFYSRILQGIDEEVFNRGYHVSFMYTAEQMSSKPVLFSKVAQDLIDGIIMFGVISPIGKEVFEEVLKRLPVLVAINMDGLAGVDLVNVDKSQGTYDAVKYLVELGHRRIGYIGDPQNPNDLNFEGYLRAVRELGLEYDEQIIEGGLHKGGYEQGYDSMNGLIRKGIPLPTAVFARSDMTAIGAMAAAKSCGIKIPDELSVVGFDDIDEACRATPVLSTMRVNKEELGAMGVRRLIERIQNPGQKPLKVTTSAELVIRESCREITERT